MKLHSVAKGFYGNQKRLAMETVILAARSTTVSHGILFSYDVSAERIIYT